MTARSRLFKAAAVFVALAAGAAAATAAAGRQHTTASVPKPALVWSGANRGGNGTRDIWYRLPGQPARDLTPDRWSDSTPAVSPDGQTIAYSTNRSGTGKTEIWLMDLDGGDPRQLTRSGPNDEPAWSPDGKRIAFQSTRDGHYEIYVINVDGTGLQRLTTSTGYANDEPAWSPDGKRIAFVSGRPGKPVGAYTMAADGSDVRYVAPTSIGNAYPAWSPDGSTLALTYANALWVVPSAGGKPKKLTEAVASIQSPSWSPDGKQIAVNWAITKTDWEIFAIPVGNPGAAKNISDDVGAKVKGDDRYPDWAPVLEPEIEADGICKPKEQTIGGVGGKVRMTWTGTRPTRVKFGLHALDVDLGTRKAPYSATVVLQAAGLAKYDCGIVQDNYIVRVPPISSPSDPNTIIWATNKARASWVYDVQYRKAGDAKWTWWQREAPPRSKRFVVAGGGAGTYEFRARMFQFDRGSDNTIGFSPTLTVELK